MRLENNINKMSNVESFSVVKQKTGVNKKVKVLYNLAHSAWNCNFLNIVKILH